jgi:hypothetical protein
VTEMRTPGNVAQEIDTGLPQRRGHGPDCIPQIEWRSAAYTFVPTDLSTST